MTFKEQVQRDSAVDVTAYEFKALNEAMEITRGIVFVYARWSGTAIHSWRSLTTALADLESRPRLFVVDADEINPNSVPKLLGDLPQGKGETVWIKDGMTLAKLSGYTESDKTVLIENSIRVLS